MGKWVSLKEALMSQLLQHEYGDLTKRQINYVPDQKSVQLTKADTGVEKVQSFSTEKNHTWYPFIYKGEIYLIAGEVTEAKLWLYGEVGYENGISSLQKTAKLYGNDSLEAEGTGMTLPILNSLPKHKHLKKEVYWLLSSYKYKCDTTNQLGFYNIFSGVRFVYSNKVSNCHLCHLQGSMGRKMYGYNFAMRPLVRIQSNTEVYIDGSNEPLEIRIKPRGINV